MRLSLHRIFILIVAQINGVVTGVDVVNVVDLFVAIYDGDAIFVINIIVDTRPLEDGLGTRGVIVVIFQLDGVGFHIDFNDVIRLVFFFVIVIRCFRNDVVFLVVIVFIILGMCLSFSFARFSLMESSSGLKVVPHLGQMAGRLVRS